MDLKQLEQVLREVNRCTFVTIVADTVPDMRKTDNPYFGRVVKRTKVNGAICWSYEKAMNRLLEKAGDEPNFEAQPRKWGERIPKTPLVEHKGKLYVEVKVERVLESVFVDMLTGTEVDKSVLEPFLRKQNPNPTGLRDYTLENIKMIAMQGAQHMIGD